jgi:hypothetical protein
LCSESEEAILHADAKFRIVKVLAIIDFFKYPAEWKRGWGADLFDDGTRKGLLAVPDCPTTEML